MHSQKDPDGAGVMHGMGGTDKAKGQKMKRITVMVMQVRFYTCSHECGHMWCIHVYMQSAHVSPSQAKTCARCLTITRSCMRAYSCAYIRTSVYAYSVPYMRLRTHTFKHGCMHTVPHTCAYAYIHANMDACIQCHIHTLKHTYIQTWVHAYIVPYIRLRIHTFKHGCMHAVRQGRHRR